MSLKYALHENLLTERLDDYTAQPQDVKSHDNEVIIERMAQKGSTVTKSDILAVLNTFFEVVEDITEEGGTVNTGQINTHFSIQGVFEEATDTFDPHRHNVRLNISAGKALKKVLPRIPLEKTAALEVLPHVLEVKDSVSGKINETLTSGGVFEIIGSMLKIAGENKSNGIALVNAEGTAYKTQALVSNMPTKLIAVLPDLPFGEYTLQVTTQYNRGPIVRKEPRTGVFNRHLTVQ